MTSVPLPPRLSPRDVRRIVMALSGAHLLSSLDRALASAIAPLVRSAFGLSDTMLGIILGPSFGLVYGIAALLLGRWIDRGAARRLLLAGLALWSLAAASLATAAGGGELVAGMAMLALGQAMFVPTAMALLAGEALALPGEGVAARLSRFTAGSALGRSIGLFVAGTVLWGLAAAGIAARPHGWRLLCVVTALPNLMLWLWLSRHLPARFAHPAPDPRLRRDGGALLAACLLAVPPILTVQALAMWLPSMIVRAGIADTATAPMAIGICTALGAPSGQIAGGWLTARIGWCRAHPARLAALALAAATPCVAIVGAATSLPPLALALVAATLLLGIASFAALIGAQAAMAPARRGALTGAFLALVTMFGTGAGPLLTGLVGDLSDRPAGDIGAALTVVALFATVLAMAALMLGRILGRTGAPAA